MFDLRYLITKKKTSGNFLCHTTLMLGHAQVRCTRIGRSRVKEIQLSSESRNHRQFIPPTAIESVPNLSGHAMAYRWRSLPRVRRHRISSPLGSFSNGCCLFRRPLNVRLSFPTPTIVCSIQKASEAAKILYPPVL